MDFLRTIVSGNKKRYKDRKYNLDLSYITPRIIAMAYPASGIESVYRNEIEKVSKFLKERHKNNYLVFNLSGKKYDNSKFDYKVLEFDIVDHHPPKLTLVFQICKEIHNFLLANDENIVAINCRAGKGRTGTIICCYLIFSGRFNDTNDAFDYYSKKRFSKGEGITQPAQKRYVYYFEKILRENIYFPLVIGITSISINKFPNKDFNSDFFKPYFEIYLRNDEKLSFTTKVSYLNQKKIYPNKTTDLLDLTDQNFNLRVCGDVTIKMYNNCIIGCKKLGRISFNTSFLELSQNELVFNVEEIDPDKFASKNYVPKDFQIHIKFHRYCNCNNKTLPLKVCDMCEDFLKHEMEEWKKIQDIKKLYKPDILKSKKLLFKKPNEDDVETVIRYNFGSHQKEFNITGIIDYAEEDEKDHEELINLEELKDNGSSFENECQIF